MHAPRLRTIYLLIFTRGGLISNVTFDSATPVFKKISQPSVNTSSTSSGTYNYGKSPEPLTTLYPGYIPGTIRKKNYTIRYTHTYIYTRNGKSRFHQRNNTFLAHLWLKEPKKNLQSHVKRDESK